MTCQLRSISLPARSLNVLVQELEHELQRLRTSCSSPASSSSSSPAAALTALGDAYSRVEELVRLPGSRRDGDALSRPRWRKAVEEALDASVELLDLCQLATDAVASVKQHVRAVQCAHRRGDAEFSNLETQRVLRCLAKVTKNANAKKVVNKRLLAQNEMPAAVKVLSEAMAVTVAVLRGVMTSLYKRIVDTKKSRWFYVSRFLRNDRSHHLCKDLESDGMPKDEDVLKGLGDSVEGVESGLEYIFRCLVQGRVALLNMLTL